MDHRLESRELQRLLASARYYSGAIDGVEGDGTRRGIQIVGNNRGGWPHDWSYSRQRVGAAQVILAAQGHEPGIVDGWWGVNSDEALVSWSSERGGVSAAVERTSLGRETGARLPHQSECDNFYGEPGTAQMRSQLTYISPPYPMVLDWATHIQASRIRLHEMCADPLRDALSHVLSVYGERRIGELGLNRYAGAYNPRRKRGGLSWSMHAYGCAIDFYAAPNALRMGCPEALFCREEYSDFLDIMEEHGWLPAIRLWGGDAMHFQMARL